MEDLQQQAAPVQSEEPDDEDRRRRRVAAVLAVVLLLLLLLCCVSVTTGAVRRVTGPTATLIKDNRQCLQCHTELLPQFQMNAVHNPFAKQSCTICHTDHGDLYVKTYKPSGLYVNERCGVIITLEPLRRSLDSLGCGACGRVVGGKGLLEGTRETTVSVGRKPSVLKAPEPRLCYTCHGPIARLTSKQYQHNPFQAGRCTSSCHAPHASAYQKLIKAPVPVLCPTCHRMAEELALPDHHPPYEERLCVDCHQPHASDHKGVLQKRQKELCFSCHAQIEALTGMPVQHSPFINGQCTGCHKPHTSVARPLLIEDQPTLCYRCHPDIRLDFLKPSHHPVGTPLLNCSDCHQPHAALYRWLLVAEDNQLCYTCHGDKQFYYDPSKHNTEAFLYGRGLCINCHTPHGSVWAPLLIREGMVTCLQCHPTKISRRDLLGTPGAAGEVDTSDFDHNNHPVGDGWRDQSAGGQLTCYSTCHGPHGTGKRQMLKTLPDALCLRCHRVKSLP